MDRRGFLNLLGLAGASAAAVAAGALELDPERLLWVPGQKSIFLPPEKSVVASRSSGVSRRWLLGTVYLDVVSVSRTVVVVPL